MKKVIIILCLILLLSCSIETEKKTEDNLFYKKVECAKLMQLTDGYLEKNFKYETEGFSTYSTLINTYYSPKLNTCIGVIEKTEWENKIPKINYYLEDLLTRETIQDLNDYSILEQNYIKELTNFNF